MKLSTEDEVVEKKKKSEPATGLIPASSKPESKKATSPRDQEGSRDEEESTKKNKKSEPAAGLVPSSSPESKKAASTSDQEGSRDEEISTKSSAPQIEIVALESSSSSSESEDESCSEVQEVGITVNDVGKECGGKPGEAGKVSPEGVGREGLKQVETVELESSSEEEDEAAEIVGRVEVANATACMEVHKAGASDDISRKHDPCAVKERKGNVRDGEERESRMKNLSNHGGGEPVKKAGEEAKIIVKNLSRDTSIHDLLKAFGEHGTVTNTSFVPGKHYAFVMFSSAAEASNVITAMDGEKICGQVVHVKMATDRPKKMIGFKRGRAQSGQWGPGWGKTDLMMSGFL